IAAAERRVAEANEQIGIARAAYYPTVMLNASVGFEGSTFGNFLNASSLLWSVGASISQTIFDGGRRRATSETARAAYDATVAPLRGGRGTAGPRLLAGGDIRSARIWRSLHLTRGARGRIWTRWVPASSRKGPPAIACSVLAGSSPWTRPARSRRPSEGHRGPRRMEASHNQSTDGGCDMVTEIGR